MKQRGSSMVLALVALFFTASMVALVLERGDGLRNATAADRIQLRARYAAEGGLERARWAPGYVFTRQTKYEFDDLLTDWWSADFLSTVAVIPFSGHQGSVPAKNRIRRDNGVSSIRALRPRDVPLTAKTRRWSSVSGSRFSPWAFMTASS